MTTTQYVGARYVPKFAEPDQWDGTVSYEPLTIVLHDGNSYTSAQYVPVGVDISNTEFWKLTGNYNAQVEKYRQEVADIISKYDSVIENQTFVTPEQYGATGDGKIDDTAAVQKALNSGYPVMLKSVYLVTDITIPQKAVVIGFGYGVSTTGDKGQLIAHKITMERESSLYKVSLSQTNYSSSDILVYASNAPRLKIIDCNFSNFGIGFAPNPTDYWAGENIVSGCTFQNGDIAIYPMVGDSYYINCICTSTVRIFNRNLSGSSFMALCHDYSKEGTYYRAGCRAVSNYIDSRISIGGEDIYFVGNMIQEGGESGVIFNIGDGSVQNSFICDNAIWSGTDGTSAIKLLYGTGYFTNNTFMNNFTVDKTKLTMDLSNEIYNCNTNCIPLIKKNSFSSALSVITDTYNTLILQCSRTDYINNADKAMGIVKPYDGKCRIEKKVYTVNSNDTTRSVVAWKESMLGTNLPVGLVGSSSDLGVGDLVYIVFHIVDSNVKSAF